MPFGPNQINVGYGQSTNNPTGISNEVIPVNPAQTPANFVITGGSIDGTPIGTTTPAAGVFTSIKDTGVGANTLAYFDANKTLASATVGSGLTFLGGTLSAAGGSGTVTSVSVVSANGLAGTVANATTTPAITLSTSITGLLKGNGTAISAASAGTDYEVPLTFSTGLTRTTNTITVNTSQNISTLSNLTSNGFVKTSGGTGALSIDTNTYLTTTGNGSGLTGITASQVGLGSVTNDAQTKASIVPNTVPSAGQIHVGNAGGTAFGVATLSGSGATFSLSSAGVLTVSGIANASLTNSSITIAGTSTALGGTITQDTITGLSSTGLVKRTAANTLGIAVAGTDYQSAITFGTGVQTALGVNVGTAGSIVVNGGALGTPSSGTVTNLTGTASININGTVGATTPNTGAFTTLTTSGIGAIGTTSSSTTNLNLAASTTGVSSIRLPHGSAPTTPVNGDLWTTTSGLYAQINGSTVGPLGTGGGGMTNPMTTVGDIIVGGTSGTPTRLALGSNGQFLGVSGGVIGYYTPAGSGTVTNTGGALTANSVVLGAGTNDTKVAAGITTDGTSVLNLGVAGTSVGKVALSNATSGSITVQPVTGALGTSVLSLPAVTDTLAVLGKNQTFTGVLTLTPAARTSGSASYLTVTTPTDTGLTAATESIGVNFATATRTWATTGTVANQREHLFAGKTYASASASQTFTDISTVAITPPIAGTNAVFTRAHSLQIVDSTAAASSVTGALVVATALGTTATSVGIGGGNVNAGGTITGGAITSTGAFTASSTSTHTGAATFNNSATFNGTNATTAVTVTQTARTSGILPYFKMNTPADTGQTAATESPGALYGSAATRTWATTGTVATQREHLFTAPTYASASASQTFTKAATVAITGAPAAGTNGIITNAYALWVQAGKAQFDGIVAVGGLPATNVGLSVGATLTGNNAIGIVSSPVLTASANSDTLVSMGVASATVATGTFTGLTYVGHTQQTPSVTGTGTIATAYQIYIAAAPTATTKYGIYQVGTDLNYFTGAIQSASSVTDSIGNVRLIPQNSQSAAYTTVLADSGKHILHPSADTTARTFTIDSNANVAYPIGTAITFVNQNGAGTLTIAITADTMRLAGAGTTGSRTLAANGVATAIKITSTEWIISGTGLT